jgi:hypothetical protein
MSPWEKLHARPSLRGHYVQLYRVGDPEFVENVGDYIRQGLDEGEAVLVIVMPGHRKLLQRHLENSGVDLPFALQSQQLIFLDAAQTLAQFMVLGEPDWQNFETVVGTAMRHAKGHRGLRTYGEMVGLLCSQGRTAQAAKLAQLWCKLLRQSPFVLYNCFGIDIFGTECDVEAIERLLCKESQLVPTQPDGTLDTAFDRSLDEVLGTEAGPLRIRIDQDPATGSTVMPSAERTVWWLRKNLPERAAQIIQRARYHYQHPVAS